MKCIQFDDTILGEASLSFKVNRNNFVHLWIGTFDSLMRYAKPKDDGYWDELSLHYHMHNEFYEKPNWQVPSIGVYLNCLVNIDVKKSDTEVIKIKEQLIELFEYALIENLSVIINYD